MAPFSALQVANSGSTTLLLYFQAFYLRCTELSQVCHLLITYIIKYFLILQGFPCFFLHLML